MVVSSDAGSSAFSCGCRNSSLAHFGILSIAISLMCGACITRHLVRTLAVARNGGTNTFTIVELSSTAFKVMAYTKTPQFTIIQKFRGTRVCTYLANLSSSNRSESSVSYVNFKQRSIFFQNICEHTGTSVHAQTLIRA